MRIVHISIYPPQGRKHAETGGVASYTKNLVTSIPYANRDEIWVLANKTGDKRECYDEDGVHVIRCFDRKPGFVRQIMAEIRAIRPDAVHVQQELALYGGLATAVLLRFLLRRLARIARTVVTLHGVVSLAGVDRGFVRDNNSRLPPFLVRRAFAFIYKPLCRHADLVVVHEPLFGEILRDEYRVAPKKIAVIPHGVEDLAAEPRAKARRELKLPGQARLVLYMGYLTGYKGLDLLIDGFAAFARANKNAFLVIGAGPHPKLKSDPVYKAEYERICAHAREKLGNRHRWVGFIAEDDIARYYSAADVTIFPYTVSMSSSGPMALSLGYNRPFVASDVFTRVFSDTRLLFAREPAALAARLATFFEKPRVAETIMARLRRERLWKNVGKRTYAKYRASSGRNV